MKPQPPPPSFDDQIRHTAHAGLGLSVAALALGLLLALGGFIAGTAIVILGLVVLLTLPVVNVFAALIEELRRREWGFAVAAAAVLAILAFNVYRAIG